jgi:ribosomal protein S24E
MNKNRYIKKGKWVGVLQLYYNFLINRRDNSCDIYHNNYN